MVKTAFTSGVMAAFIATACTSMPPFEWAMM